MVVERFGGFETKLVICAEETDVAGSSGEGEMDDVGGEEVFVNEVSYFAGEGEEGWGFCS